MRYRLATRTGAWALVLATLAITGASIARAQDEGLPIGSKPPAFKVRTLKGTTLNLTKQTGKIVVLDFWATWCVSCRDSFPLLQEIHQKYGNKGLIVVGVSNEERGLVAPFAKKKKMTYSVAGNTKIVGDAMEKYKVVNLPTLVVMDKKGIIRMYEAGFDTKPGRGTKAKLEALIKKLLAEKV